MYNSVGPDIEWRRCVCWKWAVDVDNCVFLRKATFDCELVFDSGDPYDGVNVLIEGY